MNLYFGNIYASISTLLLISVFAYIAITITKQNKIEAWGRRVTTFVLLGLFLCIFVAIRDNYVLSVQAAIDKTGEAGLFTTDSIQSSLCCIGGGIIAFCSLSSIFIRKQRYRKAMFFIMSTTILLKAIIIEISRVGVN